MKDQVITGQPIPLKEANLIYRDRSKLLSELQRLIKEIDILADDKEEALKKIKQGLQICHFNKNIAMLYEQEYELFLRLAEIYSKGNNKLDFPKAVGIYQYILKLIEHFPSYVDKEELYKTIEDKIYCTEESFIKQARTNNQLPEEYSKEKNIEKTKNYINILSKIDVLETDKEGKLDFTSIEKKNVDYDELHSQTRRSSLTVSALIKKIIKDSISELGGIPKVQRADGSTEKIKFVVLNLGSRALGTDTRWSDIEWIIVIGDNLSEYDKRIAINFFKNVSLHVLINVIKLGETPLRLLGIKELNDFKLVEEFGKKVDWFYDNYTTPGFSFDGPHWYACKTPLGREEGFRKVIIKEGEKSIVECAPYKLVGTINDFLRFQTEEIWYQEDPHLMQALLKVCRITGSEELKNLYENKIKNAVSEDIRQARILNIFLGDLNTYNPWKQVEFESEGAISYIKKEIFRFPERIIAALRQLLPDNKSNNLWEFIENCEFFSNNAKEQLIKTLTIACNLRLEIYSANNGQRESAWAFRPKDGRALEDIRSQNMEKVSGIKDTEVFYTFYTIAFSIANFFTNKLLYTDNKLDIKKVIKLLPYQDFASSPRDNLIYKGLTAKKLMDYKLAVEAFQNAEQIILPHLDELIARRNKKLISEEADLLSLLYMIMIDSLFNLNQLEVVEEYIKRYEQAIRLIPKDQKPYRLSSLEYQLYKAYSFKGLYEKALEHASKCVEVRKHITKSDNVEKEGEASEVHRHINFLMAQTTVMNCYYSLGQYNLAIEYGKSLENEYKKIPIKRIYANFLSEMGDSFFELSKYAEALIYFTEASNIYTSMLGNLHYNTLKAKAKIGHSYYHLGEIIKAEEYCRAARDGLVSTIGKDNRIYLDVILTLSKIYLEEKPKEAEELIKEAKELCNKYFAKEELRYASVLLHEGLYLQHYSRNKEAKIIFKQCYDIRLAKLGPNHINTAIVLFYLANLSWKVKKYTKATNYYLEITVPFKLSMGIDHDDYRKLIFNICAKLKKIEHISIDTKLNLGRLKTVVEEYIGYLSTKIRQFTRILNHIHSIDDIEQNNEFIKEQLKNVDVSNMQYIEHLVYIYIAQEEYDLVIRYNLLLVAIRSTFRENSLEEKLKYAISVYELGKGYFLNKDRERVDLYFNMACEEINQIITICYQSNDIDNLIKYQEELAKLAPSSETKQNLACFLHTKALLCEIKGDNIGYKHYITHAEEMFEEAIREGIEENPILSIEYTMFLLKHHELFSREKYDTLLPSLKIIPGNSFLENHYGQMDKITIIDSLYKILSRTLSSEDVVKIKSSILATCLIIEALIVLEEHIEARNEISLFKNLLAEESPQDLSYQVATHFISNAEQRLNILPERPGGFAEMIVSGRTNHNIDILTINLTRG